MGKLNKLSFGFSAMQSGQKSATVNAEPRLIANSTVGKFVVTSPVTKVLGVCPGENIMFLNNISNIENAINERNADLVAWCEENGVDMTTNEGREAILNEFTVWAIAKGIPMFDSKGNPVMANERYTKDDKLAFVKANASAVLDYVNNSDADDKNRNAILNAFGTDEFTEEDVINAIESEGNDKIKDAIVAIVESPKFHANTGSKTMSTGNATGIGCQLSFTDTNFWTALKNDLKDDKEKKNRIFSVILKEDEETGLAPYPTEITNGKDMVKVTAYPIVFVKDEDPIVREKKN